MIVGAPEGFFRSWMEEAQEMVKILPWVQRFIGIIFIIWGIQDLIRYLSGD